MSLKTNLAGEIIGLDIGAARTGVARINTLAKIPEPLQPIDLKKSPVLGMSIRQLKADHQPCAFVIGLPRGLDGQETDQTTKVRQIVRELESEWVVDVPFFLVDEAGTTKEAEQRAGVGQSVDSVAACILLEDFIHEVERGNVENVNI